jgi:hypothetical protein
VAGWAQTAAPAKAAPAKPAAKPPAKKPVVEPPLPKAEGEQLAAAAMAHYGDYDCEFNQVVKVGLDAKNDGYLEVKFGKSAWVMKPVLSTTGALRLEDVKGRMLMLQIANKSMLMDTKMGQRVVDGCVHEKQRNFTPRPASEGIGIDPVKAAEAAAAASAASAASAAKP